MRAWVFPCRADVDITPREVAINPLGSHAQSLAALYDAIGNGCDCIAVYGAGRYVDPSVSELHIVCDDEGLLREEVPDNVWLTALSPAGERYPFKGRVLVVRHTEYGELVDLRDEDLARLQALNRRRP